METTPLTPEEQGMSLSEETSTATATTVKADVGKRIVAMIIDNIIAAIPAILIPKVGIFIAVAYLLLRDGLEFEFMKGRSLGKKLMNLELIRMDGGTMDLNASIQRNWMLAAAPAVAGVLGLPGTLWLLPLIGIVNLAGTGIVIYETYKVFTDEKGQRWGDTQASTQVVAGAA